MAIESSTQHPPRQPHLGLYLVPKAGPFLIGCPRAGCTYVASAKGEGQAIRSLAAHLVAAHMQEVA